jgi:CHAT domain-containing protein
MLLVALLGLPLAVVVRADDPKPRTDVKPPWQRLLTGNDARKADDLAKRVEALVQADRYAEALAAAEELLALQTKVQGAEHWQTVNQKWQLAALKKVAALPAEKRAGWRQAEQGAAQAQRLEQKAQYARALALLEERRTWCQEVLGEDHPATATSYNNVAGNLQEQGKYAEAGPLFHKALDIQRKLLGEDHPDTATSYNNVAGNLNAQGKHAEAEPLFQKALDIRRQVLGEDHPATATSYNNVALNLNAQGKYAEAGPLFQKALDIRRKVLGEEHPDTAAGYNNVAANLQAQGKYAEAGPLFQKALDSRRKVLGEDHPDTAAGYNNVAANLWAQGKYAEAGPLFQKALDIFRKALGENHTHTAQSYDNIAANLQEQGKHAEAGPLYQKALDIRRQVLGEDHPLTALSYHNVAASLQAQGKYAEAGPLYQKALDIRRQALGEDHPDTAFSYNSVAVSLQAQGKCAEAGPLYLKALDIRRKVLGDDHPLTATSYNNVAYNLDAQGKYAEAGKLYQKALDICRQVLGEEHPDTALSYNNVAANLEAQGKSAEAGPLCHKALDIRRKLLGEDHPLTAASYINVAADLQAQGKSEAALASLEAAARSYEAARLRVVAGGLERAAFGAQQSPYPFLAVVRSRTGRAADAWAALEADLARGLLDQMALRRGLSLTPAEQDQRDDLRTRQATLDARILPLASRPQRTAADTAGLERLVTQRQHLDESLAELAVHVSQREVAPLTQLQAALSADTAFVAWVDVADRSGGVQEHWGCVVRAQGRPHWERLPGSGPEGSWTRADTDLPGQLRAALAQSDSAAEVEALARKLHAQRLAPLRQHLEGVQRLLVAPVNRMAGIPLEALTDQYTVSYTPSGTYLARRTDRPPCRSTGLLAVGDPLFPPVQQTRIPTALPPGGLLIHQVLPDSNAARARLQAGDVLVAYAGQNLTSVEQLGQLVAAQAGAKTVIVQVWREGQEQLAERELAPGRLGVTLAKEPAREALAARRQADQLLAQVRRGETYAELPGTQVEVARLAQLFDPKDVTTLTRADATEQRLDELRRAGRLKEFRYLHLATHGQANDVRAFESALILTPPAKPPEVRVGEPYLEGRLTAGEVLDYWQLDADLVTLSACDSGLGRKGGGDGLLGFAQAFLLAGSRSVCLTLWQVDDTATALLMDRFYRNLLGKREDGAKALPKAEALREAKHWLRTLTATEALDRLGTLTQGVVRGERPARDEMRGVPRPKDAAKDYRPYAHPRYWAAFILVGDPE